ncbi:MAG: cupin domain-containing protein [Pseudomonadota bacterium]
MSHTNPLLGGQHAEGFLSQYWQRKPLLIRQALPGWANPLEPQELAGLALEEEIESRLVLEHGTSPWELRHGPFSELTFAELPETGWTLLVQGLDLWVPEVAALLDRFDFIPRWRLDDVMASLAAPGGSVGPHFDQYDVFLLQVVGERRWQVGALCDERTPLLKDTDLKILAEFTPEHEWLLRPGDMLYLPPRVSHWGVAHTKCVTYSVGFRSPSVADMLADLAGDLLERDARAIYQDPPLHPAMARDDIDTAFVAQAKRQLLELIDDDELVGDWLARFMTSPKYPDLLNFTDEKRQADWNGATYRNGRRIG